MQLFLSLLIAFPTCWRHSLRFPAPISGNVYSKRYFPVMGAPSPFQLIWQKKKGIFFSKVSKLPSRPSVTGYTAEHKGMRTMLLCISL